MKVKVCGITELAQLQELAQVGVDYAGFIFYEKSARNAGPRLEANQKEIKAYDIKKVGVFVNERAEEVKRKIKRFGLTAIQLHGDESPQFCKDLMQEAEVIKVFRMRAGQDVDAMMTPFADACHYFLFDTDAAGYGGSGKKFNWSVLENVAIGKPFFLSGGIGPGDVAVVKTLQNPFTYAVDVNSRFETAPGIKDMNAVRQFVNNLKT